jgi:hypothetical protein
VPYGPELVARIAREGGATPLLLAPARAPIASVVAALAPLLGQRQLDYRFTPRVDARASLGELGLFAAATAVRATPVEIVESPALGVGPDAIAGTGFVLDGSVLHVFAIRRDAAGFSRSGWPRPAWIDLEGPHGDDEAHARARSLTEGVSVRATSTVAPPGYETRSLAALA